MDIKKITPDFAVTAQVTPRDIPLVHSLGYRTLVCNRPDGEEASQPLFEEIETAAKLSDLETRFIPVPSSGLTAEAVAELAGMLDDLPKPVLAYCRSGARSAALYNAAVEAKKNR